MSEKYEENFYEQQTQPKKKSFSILRVLGIFGIFAFVTIAYNAWKNERELDMVVEELIDKKMPSPELVEQARAQRKAYIERKLQEQQ